MYAHGKGVLKDDNEAAKWYRRAAERGMATAQFNLGLMYSKGKGVPQNDVIAHMWYNIASSNGSKTAKKNREIIEKQMSASKIGGARNLARECMKKRYKDC